ncbi:MAG: hypothetical protein II169_02590 [Lachnospiraceae bacterium]|nr:hypothetical protein [Lachnospiraceae bacterium]
MAYLTMEFNSMALCRGVEIKVFLPTDGLSTKQWEAPYKTCYFLPGYSVDASSILTYINLRKQCELKGMAIVLVDGCNSFYVDHPERNENFSKFIGEELIEFTRKILPLSDKREDTYVAGISMGGYGAIYNGLKYRDKFSKIAGLSPAVDPKHLLNNFPMLGFRPEVFQATFGSEEAYENSNRNLFREWPKLKDDPLLPGLFMACGNADGLVWDSVSRLSETLSEAGIEHVLKETTGNHEYDVWERMADAAFSYFADIEEGSNNALVLGF